MTEQIPYTVFVATTSRKREMEFGDMRFVFVILSEKKFQGIIKQKANEKETFYISSREKTIVDGLMHSEYCGGMTEMAKAIWNAKKVLDWNKVIELAELMGVNVVLKRLGYLLEVLDIEGDVSRSIVKKIKRYPYQYLEPSIKEKIGYSKDYGLIINMTKDDILEWWDT